jgi:cobalt-zinc-cadmium efflux system outer membrane protein
VRDEILPGARSAYEAASTGFDYGKFGFLDVLDAQRTLLQAQSHYLTTLADAHRAQAAITRILGVEHD